MLKIFHGDEFTQVPDRNYFPSDITYIDFADTNDFGIDMLEEMVKQVGYDADMVFYYRFKDSNLSLDNGLEVYLLIMILRKVELASNQVLS
ncbi:hypothetical protein Hanom_Chr12g01130581 [Helianthus anomalus]